jgi:chromate reductase, NAD(P)H dehydrogenase (quinone)
MRVLGVSGSLRSASYNSALLQAAARLLEPPAWLGIFTGLAAVPPYSEDRDVERPHPAVERLRAAIDGAHGIVIATPEYNGSLPGQLKNALDWASRPYPANVLRGKPVAVVGASTGMLGAVRAQADLRKVLTASGARVLGVEVVVANAAAAFDERLRLVDRRAEQQLRYMLAELVGVGSARAGVGVVAA